MKKISILLISVLFALAVSCSNPTTNPDNTNTEDGTQNGITLAERAGTYSGTIMGMTLVIKLEANATVSSITLNGNESVDSPITIEEGATYTGTTIAPFAASVMMPSYTNPPQMAKSDAVVKIDFTSATDASQGAIAKVDMMAGNDPSQFNENSAITVELTYAATAAN